MRRACPKCGRRKPGPTGGENTKRNAAIREMYKKGMTQGEIATLYGMTRPHINRIINKRVN